MNRNAANAAPQARQRGILDVVFFSWANNVWFGVTVLVALFVYSSLGSALPPVRQHPMFDMTEMEWFHWWPFDLMIALTCVTLTVVTLKRIPLRLVNAGVWTIHVGVLVLCIGSVNYFSTKLEGDAPVFRRQAVIGVPGAGEPAILLVRPGNHITVGQGRNRHHFSVSQIFPEWAIASGEDKGKLAMMVWIDCQTPTEQFTRQLLVGYPQYTEDILSDGTRAKKRSSGDPLVDKAIEMKLDYAPQTEFFLQDTSALYTRTVGSDRWIERAVDDLPRYHDHVASLDEVSANGDRSMLPRPLDLAVPPAEESGDPLVGYDVRIKSYLRYAFKSISWQAGGEELNPVAGLTLSAGPGAQVDYELVARDPKRSTTENGQIVFRWIDSPEKLAGLLDASQGKLVFRLPAGGDEIVVALDEVSERGNDAAFRPIAGTNMTFRLRNVVDNLLMQSGELAGQSMSVATVDIKTPDRTITRFVANMAGASRDVGADGQMVKADPVIDARYEPGGAQARVTLVAGPPGVETCVLFKEFDGRVTKTAIKTGGSIAATDEVTLTLRYMIPRAKQIIRPRVIPLERRDRNARRSFSMVKVEISKDDWSHTQWLEFNQYALPNEQQAIPRRISYHPSRLRLPDGHNVELLYSRVRHELPTAIALETFELTTHTGGYTGSTNTVRDFISQLRFKSAGGWSETMQMSSNRPASYGGFWYFQSTWDPPSQGSGGMNFTGIGVGNRNGVVIQLVGTCISVVGMMFAFYVKPIIRRRVQDRARDARATGTGGPHPPQSVAAGREADVLQRN